MLHSQSPNYPIRWVKRTEEWNTAWPYYISLNHLDWVPATAQILYDMQYDRIQIFVEEDDSTHLEWLGGSYIPVQAKEATPKYVPPLWEEREV